MAHRVRPTMSQLAKAYLTDDAQLCVEAGGVRLMPVAVRDGKHRFEIGRDVGRLVLVSRSATPSQQDPANLDCRRLGVAINRIVLRGGSLELFLPHDDASLTEGFHPAEGGHRWTDGRGVVPSQWLRGLREGFALEVRINPSTLRYLTGG